MVLNQRRGESAVFMYHSNVHSTELFVKLSPAMLQVQKPLSSTSEVMSRF
jgi:hypothetical protein